MEGSALVPGTTTVQPSGEIDIWTAPGLKAQWLALVAAERPDLIVVDLTAVTFLDSSGIGALVSLRHAQQEHGGTVSLRGASRMIVSVLQITGLESTFPQAGEAP
jgi:anti-anti-sigma factor